MTIKRALNPKQQTIVAFLAQNAFVARKDFKANGLSLKAANEVVEMGLAKWAGDNLVVDTKSTVKDPKPSRTPPNKAKGKAKGKTKAQVVEETETALQTRFAKPEYRVTETAVFVEPSAGDDEAVDPTVADEDVSADIQEAIETAEAREVMADHAEDALADGSVGAGGLVVDGKHLCLCGCGGETKLVNPKRKNSKRRLFVQGHDASLKGWFLKVIRGKMPMAEFPTTDPVLRYLAGAPWNNDDNMVAFLKILRG